MNRSVAAVAVCLVLAWPGAHPRAATHDFDGDGQGDLLWRDDDGGRHVIWRSGNSATPIAVRTLLDTRWRVAGAGDFDGDGQADLLWRHAVTGANTIWRSGNASTFMVLRSVVDPAWHVAGTGDFDGDGRDDVLWRNVRDGRVSVWNAANAADARALPTIRLSWVVGGIADMDGDGNDDIVWRNVTTGGNVAWRSADPTLPFPIVGVSNLRWKVAAVDDFNADGRADIAWRNVETGANVVWPAGDALLARGLPGVPIDWFIAGSGDYDGDGRADLLWRQLPNGRNSIWNGSSPSVGIRPVTAVSNAWWRVVPYEAERSYPLLATFDMKFVEGDVDRVALYPIVLSHESDRALSVPLVYDDWDSWATQGEDIIPPLGNADFRVGDTVARLPIGIMGDTLAEPDEPFYLYFDTRCCAAIAAPSWGGATIMNDDGNAMQARVHAIPH